MQDQPLVSIVTPSFNQGKFIEETIQSVLTQDYPNIEYWVIDGGSTDNTVEILQKYNGRIKWVSEPDSGQANAINKGWKQCHGEIFAWLNSDDLYKPGAVRAAVEGFRKHPEAAIVYGGLDLVTENREFIQHVSIEPFKLERLLLSNIIGQPNAFITRWALDQVGMLYEKMNYIFDHDLWLRATAANPAVFYNQTWAEFRIHGDCKTFKHGRKFSFEVLEAITRFYGQAQVPVAARKIQQFVIARANAGVGFSLASEENYRQAMRYFIKAMLMDSRYAKNRGVWASLVWGILGNPVSQKIRRMRGKKPAATSLEEFRLKGIDEC